MYSEYVTSELQKAGWYPGRSVNIVDRLRMLESEGFAVLPEAGKILTEFGGLVIEPSEKENGKRKHGRLIFEPGAVFGDFEVCEYWQRLFGISTTPIAEGSSGEIILLVPDGSILASHQRSLYKIGTSFTDALEHSLIGGRRIATELATRTTDD